jgi:hypothetical protein
VWISPSRYLELQSLVKNKRKTVEMWYIFALNYLVVYICVESIVVMATSARELHVFVYFL